MLLISKNTFQLGPMWAAILLIGLLGYALNLLFNLFEKRLARLAPGLARGHAASRSSMLEIKGLGKTYGIGEKATHAIGDVSFAVADGEFVCVVGPSGCGKTTLLKCIAGLLPPSHGEIVLRGRVVTSPPEEMALVFQEYSRSLFPWMSVRENVQLPLRHKSLNERRAQAARRGSARRDGSREVHGSLPLAAVGRHAAARGDRPGARVSAVDPAHGRAVRVRRCPDA